MEEKPSALLMGDVRIGITVKDKPNILLIHADQHRYDCLGAYGNTDIKTPNIDALAQEGVLFENSFCPFPSALRLLQHEHPLSGDPHTA